MPAKRHVPLPKGCLGGLAGPLIACVAFLVLLAVAPVATIPVVAWQADQAAAGRPYCIIVAEPPAGDSYKQATALADFSAARMRARPGRRGIRNVFHAVLYARDPDELRFGYRIERYQRLNWSYWEMGFLPIAGQGHTTLPEKAPCDSTTGFVRHLRWLGD